MWGLDELLLVVDEHDRPVRPLSRSVVHSGGMWHRVVHIWIVNRRGEILCQQRSLSKDLNPGWWEPFFGGHMAPGEEYKEAAVRELREELGLKVSTAELEFWEVYKHRSVRHANNEFQGIFVFRWEGTVDAMKFADGEVEQVEWLRGDEVAAREFEPADGWTHIGYERRLFEECDWV